MTRPVSSIDFGRIDAESEDQLSEYFIDNGVISNLRSGRKAFVFGRKGSGKTAIFQVLDITQFGHDVIRLDFQHYPWHAHQLIREQGMLQETAYVSSWKFLFYSVLIDYISQNGLHGADKKARDILNRIYENPDKGWFQSLLNKFGRLKRIDLPQAGPFGGGGFELDDKESGIKLANSISSWINEMDRFLREHWQANSVSIVVDRLDDGWEATSDSKYLLSGVLKATRDINLAIGITNKPRPIITMLRTDIYDELDFNDKNKIIADIEYLNWNQNSLIDVIKARISRSLGCTKGESWNLAFSQTEMRQRTSIKNYMTKRTMLRPRDIVKFCIDCQSAARSNGHDKIMKDDVYSAEVEYSQYMYDEIIDELHKQNVEIKDLLQTLKDIGLTRFSYSNWKDARISRSGVRSDTDLKNDLMILFNCSAIGITRAGGRAGGASYQFKYNNKHLDSNFDKDLTVHPSLVKALQLTEPRRRKKA